MVEKYQYNNLKETVSAFERLKKRLSELFSSRFVSFLKSIHSIFDLSIGKFFNNTRHKLKTSKILFKQAKTNLIISHVVK